MAKDETLKKFTEARVKYRKGVLGLTFEPYSKVVTKALSDPKTIVSTLKEATAVQQKAVAQQAIDLMMASQRATDMRSMTHTDYIEAYKAAAPFQDAYEKSRVERFESGRY